MDNLEIASRSHELLKKELHDINMRIKQAEIAKRKIDQRGRVESIRKSTKEG